MTLLRPTAPTVLVLLLVAGSAASLSGCAARPPIPASRQAVPAEQLAPLMAEEVFYGYVGAKNGIDLANVDSFAPLASLTTESLFQEEINVLMPLYEQGYELQGAVTADSFAVREIKGQRIQAVACTDSSGYALLDSLGHPTRSPDHPSKTEMHMEFVIVSSRVFLNRAEYRSVAVCDPEVG